MRLSSVRLYGIWLCNFQQGSDGCELGRNDISHVSIQAICRKQQGRYQSIILVSTFILRSHFKGGINPVLSSTICLLFDLVMQTYLWLVNYLSLFPV